MLVDDWMTVWLVGQSILAQTLSRAPYTALNSRIQVHIWMQAILNTKDLPPLLRHAFKEAGCQSESETPILRIHTSHSLRIVSIISSNSCPALSDSK